jgi:hypothetical protein
VSAKFYRPLPTRANRFVVRSLKFREAAKPARPAPPERVDGQSRSGLDYMLAVVKHQQHLPPYASVVTTTESEVTEITET